MSANGRHAATAAQDRVIASNMRTRQIRSDLPLAPYAFFGPHDCLDQTTPRNYQQVDLNMPINFDDQPPHPFLGNPIFLSIDVKVNCAGDGETNHISEIGIAVLDTRVLMPQTTSANQAPDMLSPGPRGQNWCKAIISRHLRVKQNLHHDTRCNYRNSERHKGDAAGFLFRSSKLLDARNLHRYLDDFKKNLINRNLYTGEKERKIIMITWTSTIEIDKLKNLNTKWFEEVDGCWEVQKMAAAQRLAIKYTNGKSLSLETFCTALGLPFQSSWYHNAGNDATFALDSMIAGLFLTPAEHATLGNLSLPVLDNWWSTQSFAGNQAQNQANEQEYVTMS